MKYVPDESKLVPRTTSESTVFSEVKIERASPVIRPAAGEPANN